MRPFRFFIMLPLGILFFFFIARFLIFAFFMAALFGLVFYAGKKVLGHSPNHGRQMPVWKGDLLMDYPIDLAEGRRSERIIEVK
ncbi:MAG: hypothetical protein H6563_05795 [Lewinellaceae bacterium]|nr:hypothetical protein [Lewinellaceae bacterium]